MIGDMDFEQTNNSDLQEFRKEVYFHFFEALEDKQKEVELWALPELRNKGAAFVEFRNTLDTDLTWKEKDGYKVLVCSMYYLRPLRFLFKEYTSKVKKDKFTDLPLSIRFTMF